MTDINDSKSPDEFPEELKWGPLMTEDAMYELEKRCSDNGQGINRRLVLLISTSSADELLEKVAKNPGLYWDIFKTASDTMNFYRDLDKVIQCCHARLMTGLCAVDPDEDDAPFTREEFSKVVASTKEVDGFSCAA